MRKNQPRPNSRDSLDFAAIFSSYRIDDAFLATPLKGPLRRAIIDNGPSVSFFAQETAVSAILDRQSTPASRFNRPNTH